MTDLDIKFEKAFKIASAMTKKLPPDIMLQFYAYYKRATSNNALVVPSGNNIVRNAFKLNAYFQLNDEALMRPNKNISIWLKIIQIKKLFNINYYY